MSTNYHSDITAGAAANAATINAPLGQLDAAITNLAGGAAASDESLKEWTAGEDYEATAVTYDADGVVTTATVKWPDTSVGVFTTTSKNTTWLGIDAFTITHITSGKTVTQAAVTRDANGSITAKPALTIS